jgi:hypothetical protein
MEKFILSRYVKESLYKYWEEDARHKRVVPGKGYVYASYHPCLSAYPCSQTQDLSFSFSCSFEKVNVRKRVDAAVGSEL